MYYDKTIYILKAHVEESVMGRVFFPGGAPPPLTGGATAPHFSKIFIFAKNTYFLIEVTLLMVWGAKNQKFSRGDPFPSQGGLLPPIFQFFLFLAKYLKLYIFWISSTWCVLWAKKYWKNLARGGLSPPFTWNPLFPIDSVCVNVSW